MKLTKLWKKNCFSFSFLLIWHSQITVLFSKIHPKISVLNFQKNAWLWNTLQVLAVSYLVSVYGVSMGLPVNVQWICVLSSLSWIRGKPSSWALGFFFFFCLWINTSWSRIQCLITIKWIIAFKIVWRTWNNNKVLYLVKPLEEKI